MPQINVRQDEPHFLRLARAAGRCHSVAGRVHGARITVAATFLAAGPLGALLAPSISAGIAAASGAWAALGAFVFKRWEARFRRRGVLAQELFDCGLFGIDWNGAVAGRPPAREELHDWAEKRSEEGLRGWYPDVSQARPSLDALLCQRSSLVWGRRNHEIYGWIVLGLAGAWVVLEFVLGVLLELDVSEFLVRLFLPSLPALLLAGDIYEEHRAQASAKGAVESGIDEVWAASLATEGTPDRATIRQIQDRVFELRLGPRPPTTLYRRRRDRDQAAMEAAVSELLEELPAALRQQP